MPFEPERALTPESDHSNERGEITARPAEISDVHQLSLFPAKTRGVSLRPKPSDDLRPDVTPRRSTDPSSATLTAIQGYFDPTRPQTRPHTSHARNRSPYSRSHLRSKSSGASLLGGFAMTRAHSMPNAHYYGAGQEPFAVGTFSTLPDSSPQRSPARIPSPLRTPNDETSTAAFGPRSFAWPESGGNVVETIEEDSELDITPRLSSTSLHPSNTTLSLGRSGSLRRRPASPLHSAMGLSSLSHSTPTSYPSLSIESASSSLHTSTASSPSLGPQRFNEIHPSLHHYASSSSFGSMPSTPTSRRSRSPSISSLDTIEDAPDLESQAIELERIEQLRLAAERQERQERGELDEEEGTRRRSSFDVPRGFGRGLARERKRWSVCGAERRADLDLEVIWED